MINITWQRARSGWIHLRREGDWLPTVILAYDSYEPWKISVGATLYPLGIAFKVFVFEFSFYWKTYLHHLPPVGPPPSTLKRKIWSASRAIEFVLVKRREAARHVEALIEQNASNQQEITRLVTEITKLRTPLCPPPTPLRPASH